MKTPIVILFLVLLVMALPGCSKRHAAGPPEKQIIGTAAADEPTAFKLAWLAGKHYVFRVQNVRGNDFTPPGSTNQTVVMAVSQDYSLTPHAVDKDGVQELDMEITADRFVFQPSERNYLVSDSRQSAAEDAADPISPFLRQMLNKPFKCFMADGTLVRTEGLDTLMTNQQNAPPWIQPILGRVLSENNLKIMFDTLNASQPDDPVKVGDSWPIHLDVDPYEANALSEDGHNTFTNWDMCNERQCIHTAYQGNFSPKAGEPDDLVKTKIQDGTLSSEAWFDPQLGMLIHSSTVEHLDATILATGQAVHVNVTSEFHLLSVEEE